MSSRLACRPSMRCVVPLPVPLCVSSCIVSPCRLVVVVSLLSSRRNGAGLDVASSLPSCHSRSRSCVVSASSLRLVLRCAGRDGLRSVLSSGVSYCLVSSCLVGVGVSCRGACMENELTKTARLSFLSPPSHPARARVAGAMRIGTGRTVVRQGTVAGLFERPGLPYMPADRFRKTTIPLAPPTPWGRGDLFDACG